MPLSAPPPPRLRFSFPALSPVLTRLTLSTSVMPLSAPPPPFLFPCPVACSHPFDVGHERDALLCPPCFVACFPFPTLPPVLTRLTLSTSVMPCCSSISCASRDTVFSTNSTFGRSAATRATKILRNLCSCSTSGSRLASRVSLRCTKRHGTGTITTTGNRNVQ